MEIILSAVEKGGDYPITHDLNFAAAKYEAKHAIVGLPCTVPASSQLRRAIADVG